MRIKKPNKEFVYISPLVNCENENAKTIASLIEASMLENINLQIEFIQCRIYQIYQESLINLTRRSKNEQ